MKEEERVVAEDAEETVIVVAPAELRREGMLADGT